jgi:hypothetical protein
MNKVLELNEDLSALSILQQRTSEEIARTAKYKARPITSISSTIA